MFSLPAVDLESGGEAQFVPTGSSASLKLFSYSRQAEFESSYSAAAFRVLGNIDLSIRIADHLSPGGDQNPMAHHPYQDVSTFGRICTATYPSGMTILYRDVPHISVLWAILIDKKALLGCKCVESFTADSTTFGYIIDLAYGMLMRDLAGEDLASYRLRRFFFTCSCVRTLWGTRQSFTSALSNFFMQHIPSGRQYLFPALQRIYWIEEDCDRATMSFGASPIEIPVFQAFRPTALRFLDFEFHDFSVSLGSMLGEAKFNHRIMEFITLLRQSFPNFYVANLCVCSPDFCPHPYIRKLLNKVNAAVMKSDAKVVSKDIPLPFSDGEYAAFGIKENINVDVITGKGRTFIIDPNADRYYYLAEDCHLLSALTVVSSVSFALAYCTNMSVVLVSDEGLIVDILLPFFKKRDVQHVTLHFESVVIPLLPHDILDIGAHWRQLHYLNLDFQVVREKIEDIPTLETVWILTTYCPMLEQLYLPDFNVLGLRSAAPVVRGFSLRTMTSSVLLSSDDEAREVALVMLSAFPNLTDVMKSGFSAVGWDSIAKAINCHWYNRAGNQHSDTVLDRHDDTGIRLLAALVSPIAEEEFELDVNQDVQMH